MIILPSLEIVPAKYNTSTNTLLSQIPIDGTGDFAVTRATSATRVNGNGLIEVAKTNLAFNSQTWDASNNWQLSESSGRVTVVTSTSGTLAPDGTSTANAISPTSGNITHYLYSNASGSISYVSGTVYTISAFFKKGAGDSGRYIQIATANLRFLGNPYANFDLELGTTLTLSGSVADSNRVSRIENYGNGWYRCSLTATCGSAGSTAVGIIAVLLTADTNARTGAAFAGNTSDYIFGWGAQLEVGSSASEYIPTTTVARTTFAGVTVDGTAAANIPRLDYLQPDGTIGCPALLVEPSSANLKPRSDDWTNSTFQLLRVTQIQSANVAPLLKPMLEVRETAATGTHNIQIQPDATLVSGSTYTRTYFVSLAGRDVINFGDSGQALNDCRINFSTKTVVSQGANIISSRIVDYGNGLFLVSITFTATGAVGRTSISLFLDNTTSSYLGDITKGVNIHFIQYELGSVGTSYIPNANATGSVTRAADVIADTTASGVIGQTEGTIYWEGAINRIDRVFFALSSGITTTQAVRLQTTGGGLFQAISITGTGTIQCNIQASGAVNLGEFYKIAFAYKENDFVLYINGTQRGTDTSGTLPTNLNSIYLCNSNGTEITDQRCRAAALYPTRLTDTQLALLTSPYTSYSSMASALSYTLG